MDKKKDDNPPGWDGVTHFNSGGVLNVPPPGGHPKEAVLSLTSVAVEIQEVPCDIQALTVPLKSWPRQQLGEDEVPPTLPNPHALVREEMDGAYRRVLVGVAAVTAIIGLALFFGR